jgi:hypothetical protein
MGEQAGGGQLVKRYRIAVWFSRGAASAVAAKLSVVKWARDHEVRVLTTPIKEEDEGNYRFEKDVEKWLDHPIEHVTHPDFPTGSAKDVWGKTKAMSFPTGAPCTRLLKRESRQIWENSNCPDWHVFGFTADEQKRHDRFVLTERSNVLPVLIYHKLTKEHCYDLLRRASIAPPRVYSWGLPNANCLGCVKATSPTYWNLIRDVAPEVFQDRAEQSRQLNVRLARHKGKRVFLDELPPDAKGRPLKSMSLECGIICEEPEK